MVAAFVTLLAAFDGFFPRHHFVMYLRSLRSSLRSGSREVQGPHSAVGILICLHSAETQRGFVIRTGRVLLLILREGAQAVVPPVVPDLCFPLAVRPVPAHAGKLRGPAL